MQKLFAVELSFIILQRFYNLIVSQLMQTGMQSGMDSWGVVTLDNYNEKCEETKKFGHYRLVLGLYCAKTLTDLNAKWWLDAGNLLGAYRDGKMIAHDTDFDIGVFATEDQFKNLYSQLSQKLDQNFKLRKIDTFCHRIQVFDPHFGSYLLEPNHKLTYHNVTVNIQLYCSQSHNKVKMMYFKDDYLDHVNLEEGDIFPLQKIKYCSHMFSCPNKIERYLEKFYGYLGLGAEYDKVTRKYRENRNIPKNVSNKADQGNHDNLKNQ